MNLLIRALLFGLIAVTALTACSDDDDVQQLASHICEQRFSCEDETNRSYAQIPLVGAINCSEAVARELQETIDEDGVICRYAFDRWVQCQRENDCTDFLLPGICVQESDDLRSACGDLGTALAPPDEQLVDTFCEREEVCGPVGDDSYTNCHGYLEYLTDELRTDDSDCYEATLNSMHCLATLNCDADPVDKCTDEIMAHLSQCEQIPDHLPSHRAARDACDWQDSCREDSIPDPELDRCRREYTDLLLNADSTCHDTAIDAIDCMTAQGCSPTGCNEDMSDFLSVCDELPSHPPMHPAADARCSWEQTCRADTMSSEKLDRCRTEYTELLLGTDNACYDAAIDAIDCMTAQGCPLTGCDSEFQEKESHCGVETIASKPHWPAAKICERKAECGFTMTDSDDALCIDFFSEQLEMAAQNSQDCYERTVQFYDCRQQQSCSVHPFKACEDSLTWRVSRCGGYAELPHPSAHLVCERYERCGFFEPGDYEECVQEISESLRGVGGGPCYDAAIAWYDCEGTTPCGRSAMEDCSQERDAFEFYCNL